MKPMFDSPIQDLIAPWRLKGPSPNIVFARANVINPVDGSVQEDVSVYVAGGHIKTISKADELENTEGVHHVDLDGKFLCPGLIDCHVHLVAVPGASDLESTAHMSSAIAALRMPYLCGQMLDRGFTSVRDCGGAQAALKQAIDENLVRGPQLFIAGHGLSQSGGSGEERSIHDHKQSCCGAVLAVARICDGVPECMKAAREELRCGADFIKIFAGGGVTSPTGSLDNLNFSVGEIAAIVNVAKNAGTYVTAHAYTPQAIRQAIELGVRGIEHGNFIDESTAKLMAEKSVFLTPTLVAYAAVEAFPFPNFLPPASAAKAKGVLEAGLRSLKIASEAGVTLCYGSDLLGPLHDAQTHEFSLRRRVLTDLKVLQSATVNAARMMGQDKLGALRPGFLADFIILNKNPLEDVTILDDPDRHLLAVVKGGRVVSSRWSKVLVEESHHLPQIE
ncbi:related to linoleate diol synthase [Phialocephala subalpina]|uniref:Related to linoleate diol synthase n=1 Tax=Phialocephala subalpina TaxID=576137 RepID=A0A1L7XXQ7_9HELO|nr:related to linoleate diol synthase [Phialocephala subalpina]